MGATLIDLDWTSEIPMVDNPSPSEPRDPLVEVASEIAKKARDLESESRSLRRWHQVFTVLTILLGVSAPAAVTYSPPDSYAFWWKLIAIGLTAFATASATLRTVLRFSERYSNSALTAIALLDLWAELHAKRQEVLVQVKEEYKSQKLFEYAAWGRKQMFAITKAFVEKDVSAITQERIDLNPAPSVQPDQMADPTRKSNG
ncbi:MAG TPA: DUF4231 domain-containing protein [Thermoanaerobaculia bacterium]|nr:DUF4231 domain-containing protein [Thermoanaerobaculia bacterium]